MTINAYNQDMNLVPIAEKEILAQWHEAIEKHGEKAHEFFRMKQWTFENLAYHLFKKGTFYAKYKSLNEFAEKELQESLDNARQYGVFNKSYYPYPHYFYRV